MADTEVLYNVIFTMADTEVLYNVTFTMADTLESSHSSYLQLSLEFSQNNLYFPLNWGVKG